VLRGDADTGVRDAHHGLPPLPARAAVTWTVPGADQYVVEFAQDSRFQNKVTHGPFYIPYTAGTVTSTAAFDLSKDFQRRGRRRADLLPYRRTSTDEPGPAALYTPNGGNDIYSADSTSFAKLGTRPAPPS